MILRKQEGFTLLELMIATAMLGLIGAMMMSLYLFTVRSSNALAQQSEVQQSVRFVKGRIEETLRFSTSADIANSQDDSSLPRRIYLEDGHVWHHDGTSAVKFSVLSDEVAMTLNFENLDLNTPIVRITVGGSIHGKYTFEVSADYYFFAFPNGSQIGGLVEGSQLHFESD